MLHEKPRPIYIRPGMSQWGQKVFEDECPIFLLSFELFTRFTKDFPNRTTWSFPGQKRAEVYPLMVVLIPIKRAF